MNEVTSINEIRKQIANNLKQEQNTKIITTASGNTYEIKRLSPLAGLKFGIALGASNVISQEQGRGQDTTDMIMNSEQIEKYFLMTLENGLVSPALEKEELSQFIEALPNDAIELFTEILAMSQGKQVIDLRPFRTE